MRLKINKRTIESLRPKEGRYSVWDTELKGFCVRVTPTGAMSFGIKYLTTDHKQRWYTIGKVGTLTPIAARKEAELIQAQVRQGIDPQGLRVENRQSETITELCDQYLENGCSHKKPSTIATDIGRIKRHIKPLLGSLKVKDVTIADVRRFRDAIIDGKTSINIKTSKHGRARVTGGTGTAKRTLGLLGGIFRYAIEEGLRSDNPTIGVKRGSDNSSKRYLNFDEIDLLGQKIDEAEVKGINPIALNVIRMLMFTGARKSEVLTLKWDHVSYERSCLELPDSKTGAKVIPIGVAALELLKGIEMHHDNPYVFPGSKLGSHIIGVPKIWNLIKADAGLHDVTLHTLRHTFASVAISGGMSLPMVGALLGHSDPKTTSRYSHLMNEPALQAANMISGSISEALNRSRNK